MWLFRKRRSGVDPSAIVLPGLRGSTASINGERIRVAREKSGLSWVELESRTRLTRRQLKQLEDGESSAFHGYAYKVRAARLVARALSCPDDAFLEGQEGQGGKGAGEGPPAADPGSTMENGAAPPPARRRPWRFRSNLPSSARQSTSGRRRALRWCALIAMPAAAVVVLMSGPDSSWLRDHGSQPGPPGKGEAAMGPRAPGMAPASPGCAPGDAPPSISFMPSLPAKAANAVEISSRSPVDLCVSDITGVLLRRTVAAGEAIAIGGQAPFVVFASSYTDVEFLFQGQKVPVVSGYAGPVALIGSPANLADLQQTER